MDGIREPKADGGTIGGGVIQGRPTGQGRTGFNIINFIRTAGAPLLTRAKGLFGTNVSL